MGGDERRKNINGRSIYSQRTLRRGVEPAGFEVLWIDVRALFEVFWPILAARKER